MTSSNGNIFRVTGPLCGEFTGPGEFPTQRPVAQSFDVFFDLRLKKRLSKQPWGWWFETLSWSLWRHCNDYLSCSWYRLLTHKFAVNPWLWRTAQENSSGKQNISGNPYLEVNYSNHPYSQRVQKARRLSIPNNIVKHLKGAIYNFSNLLIKRIKVIYKLSTPF